MFQGSLSGFVLVGGRSLRMGRDKALLPYSGCTLAEHIAEEVGKVAKPVCFVGDPGRYGSLGLPVIRDLIAERGPLAGMEAALLSDFASEWNLIVACDMPRVDAGLFHGLLKEIGPEVDCVVPRSVTGKLEPLCALYRKRCGPVMQDALARGTRRVVDAVAMLQARFWLVDDAVSFQNVNTAPEWDRFLNDR